MHSLRFAVVRAWEETSTLSMSCDHVKLMGLRLVISRPQFRRSRPSVTNSRVDHIEHPNIRRRRCRTSLPSLRGFTTLFFAGHVDADQRCRLLCPPKTSLVHRRVVTASCAAADIVIFKYFDLVNSLAGGVVNRTNMFTTTMFHAPINFKSTVLSDTISSVLTTQPPRLAWTPIVSRLSL